MLFRAERFELDERFEADERLVVLRRLLLFFADAFRALDFLALFFAAAIVMPPELELSTRPAPRWAGG